MCWDSGQSLDRRKATKSKEGRIPKYKARNYSYGVCYITLAKVRSPASVCTIWLGNVGTIADYILRHLISHVTDRRSVEGAEYGRWAGSEIRKRVAGLRRGNRKTSGR